MQEAYRPPCNKYSLCCPNWVPPLAGYPPARVPTLGRVPPSQGTPPGYPPARVPPWPGYPPARVPPQPGYPPGQGTPPAGPGRVPPQLHLAGYPPSCPMAFWEMLQSIMGYGYPPPVDRQIDGQTRVKTLPSRRTTYAGGKKPKSLSLTPREISYCEWRPGNLDMSNKGSKRWTIHTDETSQVVMELVNSFEAENLLTNQCFL